MKNEIGEKWRIICKKVPCPHEYFKRIEDYK